jgi:hypothetical protein
LTHAITAWVNHKRQLANPKEFQKAGAHRTEISNSLMTRFLGV